MAYIPPDHGNTTDLAADDHPQYQTDAEADALYPGKTGAGATGKWPINTSGSAASAATAGSSTYAHDAASVDGQTWHWSDVGLQTYWWTASDGNNVSLCWEGNFARATHNHNDKYGIIFGSFHYDVGTLAAGTAYGPWTFPHSLAGNAPKMVMITGTYDDGVHSIVTSVGNLWDGTNVQITARNVASSNEACALCMIAWV